MACRPCSAASRRCASAYITAPSTARAEPPAGEGPAVARQLAHLAESGQALISGTAVMLLGGAARQLVGSQPLSGPVWTRIGVPVHAIGQRSGLVTSIPGRRPPDRAGCACATSRRSLFVEELRPVLLLGRELANDITIMDPRASRQHARIERRPRGLRAVRPEHQRQLRCDRGQARVLRQAGAHAAQRPRPARLRLLDRPRSSATWCSSTSSDPHRAATGSGTVDGGAPRRGGLRRHDRISRSCTRR